MIKLYQFNRPYIICSLLFLALLLSVSAHPAQGRDEYLDIVDYYVAINGDDANLGTQSLPWRTVQFAVDQVGPGDTIYVRAGMYNESVALNQAGVEGSPITLTVYGDEIVTIDGGEDPAINARWKGTQYWVIEGFSLDSNAERTLELSAWSGYWSDHMIIRNNYIRGAAIVSGSYNLFDGNEVDGSLHKGNENGVTESQKVSHHNVYKKNHIHDFKSRGIWSMHRTHDSVFENNYIHHIENGNGYETGIDLDGFGTVVWRHIVLNNHLQDVGKVAIALENTFDSIVENNILHNSRTGISNTNYGGDIGESWGTDKRCEAGGEHNQYGDTDGDNDCRGNITGNILRQNLIFNINSNTISGIMLTAAGGVRILNNTIQKVGGPGILLWKCAESYCPQIEIQGNIISDFSRGAIDIRGVNSLVKDSNNLIHNPNGDKDYYIADTWYSLAQYQNTTGKGTGSIKANPLFVDPINNNFHLQSNSPAIDAGIDVGLTADLDGNPRPQGLGYDLGAREYSELKRIYLPTLQNNN